jgi:hypothetical protein
MGYVRAAIAASVVAWVCAVGVIGCSSPSPSCEELVTENKDVYRRIKKASSDGNPDDIAAEYECTQKVQIRNKDGSDSPRSGRWEYDVIKFAVTISKSRVVECLGVTMEYSAGGLWDGTHLNGAVASQFFQCMRGAALFRADEGINSLSSQRRAAYEAEKQLQPHEELYRQPSECNKVKFFVPKTAPSSTTDRVMEMAPAVPVMIEILGPYLVPVLLGENECTSEVKQCSSEDGTCPEGDAPAWEEPSGGDVFEPGTLPGLPPPDDGDHL